MRSSPAADDDVDMVDSVAGLRQILSHIADVSDDDDDDKRDVQLDQSLDSKPVDDSQPSLEVKQSADSSIVMNGKSATELDEKSDEKLENTSETDVKYTLSDGLMMDEVSECTTVDEKKTGIDDRGTVEKSADGGDEDIGQGNEVVKALLDKPGDGDGDLSVNKLSAADVGEASGQCVEAAVTCGKPEDGDLSVNKLSAADVGEDSGQCVEAAVTCGKPEDEDLSANRLSAAGDVGEVSGKGNEDLTASYDMPEDEDEDLSDNKLSAAAAAAAADVDDVGADAGHRSSILTKLCAGYDDVEPVRTELVFVLTVDIYCSLRY